MPAIETDRSLADLVEENPARARVFEEKNLDFCCGGEASLAEACDEHEIDVDALREELKAVDERENVGEDLEFDSLSELTDFIVDHHHDYLRDELGPLGELVEKVERVHGDEHPELHEVADAFEELAREIPVHLSEEEQILFPAVRTLDGGDPDRTELSAARQLLDGLVDDHDETADHLEQIREATDDYEVPEDACPSYENMLERLERLEHDFHLHVHRENHMLFEQFRDRVD